MTNPTTPAPTPLTAEQATLLVDDIVGSLMERGLIEPHEHKSRETARVIQRHLNQALSVAPRPAAQAGEPVAKDARDAMIKAREVMRAIVSLGAKAKIGTLYSAANTAAWQLTEVLNHAHPADAGAERAQRDLREAEAIGIALAYRWLVGAGRKGLADEMAAALEARS